MLALAVLEGEANGVEDQKLDNTFVEFTPTVIIVTATPTIIPPTPTSVPEPTQPPPTPSPVLATATPRITPVAPLSTPVSSAPLPPAPPIAGHNPVAEFIRGYEDAGGPPQYLYNIVTFMIPCESGWNANAYSSAGPYYGLAQFSMATWNSVGGGNIYDPYTQGRNTARLIAVASPRTQWPVCWRG